MRKYLFWSGWVVLSVLPVIYVIQGWIIQDLPPVEPWKWLVPLAAVALIVMSRNTDDVLKHRVL